MIRTTYAMYLNILLRRALLSHEPISLALDSGGDRSNLSTLSEQVRHDWSQLFFVSLQKRILLTVTCRCVCWVFVSVVIVPSFSANWRRSFSFIWVKSWDLERRSIELSGDRCTAKNAYRCCNSPISRVFSRSCVSRLVRSWRSRSTTA